ncbi:MAG: hypothetical protein ACOYM5_09190 [Caulobacter sp.]
MAEIDQALIAGGKLVSTGVRFGVTKSSLGRHKNRCLAPKLAAAARMVRPAAEVLAPVRRAEGIVRGDQPAISDLLGSHGLLERLARSLERLEGAADAAAGNEMHGALAALSGQIHRGVEAAGKLQGLYSEPEAKGGSAFSINIVIPPAADINSAGTEDRRGISLSAGPREVLRTDPSPSVRLHWPQGDS